MDKEIVEPRLDVRHERIIKEVKDGAVKKEMMSVGAGDCRKDYHLIKDGFKVISTDYQRTKKFDDIMKDYDDVLDYHLANIFDISSFPQSKVETVICCEVLEHLVEYKEAFKNLLELTEKRLVITVPWKHSFNHPAPPPEGHCNHWDDKASNQYKDINEYVEMAKPHKVHIEKIITKERDKQLGQRSYLIVIDKV